MSRARERVVTTPEHVPIRLVPAGVGSRFLALLVDFTLSTGIVLGAHRLFLILLPRSIAMAANQTDAERRLRQMYHHCEIIHCQTEAVTLRNDPLDLEGVIGIISNEPATLPSVARSRLRNKSGTH